MSDYNREAMAMQNKGVRGHIIRSLAMGPQYRLPVVQISNILRQSDTIISPDISKYLDYLRESGYIEFTDDNLSAYTAYAKNGVVRLTRRGVDLVEGTIADDGVDV